MSLTTLKTISCTCLCWGVVGLTVLDSLVSIRSLVAQGGRCSVYVRGRGQGKGKLFRLLFFVWVKTWSSHTHTHKATHSVKTWSSYTHKATHSLTGTSKCTKCWSKQTFFAKSTCVYSDFSILHCRAFLSKPLFLIWKVCMCLCMHVLSHVYVLLQTQCGGGKQ